MTPFLYLVITVFLSFMGVLAFVSVWSSTPKVRTHARARRPSKATSAVQSAQHRHAA